MQKTAELITIRKDVREFPFIEIKACIIIKFIHRENAEHEHFNVL